MRKLALFVLVVGTLGYSAERLHMKSFPTAGYDCHDAKAKSLYDCRLYLDEFSDLNEVVSQAYCLKKSCACTGGSYPQAVCLGWVVFEDQKECDGKSRVKHFAAREFGYSYNDALTRTREKIYWDLRRFSKEKVSTRFYINPCQVGLSGNIVVATCTARITYTQCNQSDPVPPDPTPPEPTVP